MKGAPPQGFSMWTCSMFLLQYLLFSLSVGFLLKRFMLKFVYCRIHNWMRCSKCLVPYVGCSWFPLHNPTKWHHLHLLDLKDTLKSSFVSLACTDLSSSNQVLIAVLHPGTWNARQWCRFEEHIHRIRVLKQHCELHVSNIKFEWEQTLDESRLQRFELMMFGIHVGFWCILL